MVGDSADQVGDRAVRRYRVQGFRKVADFPVGRKNEKK